MLAGKRHCSTVYHLTIIFCCSCPILLALFSNRFNPRYASAKMNLGQAKNTFIPGNINSIVILPLGSSSGLGGGGKSSKSGDGGLRPKQEREIYSDKINHYAT